MNILLVITADDGLPAVRWAQRIAAAEGAALCILCPSRDAASRFQEVSAATPDLPPLVQAALEAAGDAGPCPTTVYDLRAGSIHRGILDVARELDAQQLILHARVGAGRDANATALRLARGAPYDVLVLDTGERPDPPRRVVVPQLGGGAAHAIGCAARCFGTADRSVLVLPDDQARSRSRRVFRKAADRLKHLPGVSLRHGTEGVAIDDALSSDLAAGDLILLDADEARRVPRLLSRLAELRAERQDVPFAVGLTRAEDAAGPGRLERAVERFRRFAPVLTRSERRDLHELLDKGGRLSTDFVVMLSLSAAIAALGLIQSSPSVVIGAMLVAPLMTPLVAIGMSLAQGNARLFRVASHAMLLGVLGALVVSMIVGLLSPWSDLSSEVIARGSPNVFDLMIALLSGMAASFALARPGLAGTLVGVAIAVALVPPLAAAGIAMVKAEFQVALGAAVLFSTNLLAIVVGSALVFRLFGVDSSTRGAVTPTWVRTTLVAIIAGLLVTTSVLVQNLNLQTTEGVHRPYARPLPPDLRDALLERVAHEPGVEIFFMAESEIEHGFGVEVALCSDGPIKPSLTGELREIIESYLGADRPARIVALRSADARH